jgi:5-formyltetrahydrofolate cyclo-ligase
MTTAQNTLRQELTRVVSSLDQRWTDAASREVSARVFSVLSSLAQRQIQHVLICNNFSAGEVDLSGLISYAPGSFSLYFSRLLVDGDINFVALNAEALASWQNGSIEYGALTAAGSFDFKHAARAAIIVPALAYDRLGFRLGYGPQRVSRLLLKTSFKEILKIGVCWALQVVPEVPLSGMTAHVDWVCTEEEAIRCAANGGVRR